MHQLLGVELFCLSCNTETMHQAVITDGHMDSLRCLTCDQTTTLRGEAVTMGPAPFPTLQVGTLPLGKGNLALEGGIRIAAQPFMHQALAAVRAGLALRELDCRVLRVEVDTPEQLQLVVNLKTVTGLPVLVDVGAQLSLLTQVALSQADGAIFTCARPEDADTAGLALGSGYAGALVVRMACGSLRSQLEMALAAVRRLSRWHHQNLAVTPQVTNAGEFAEFSRSWQERSVVPVRAQLPLPAFAANPAIAAAVALGAICNQQSTALAGLPVLTAKNRVVYETATTVLAHLNCAQQEDLLATLMHMAGKAVDRALHKPGRILHEMESTPAVFVRSLPSRIITKPGRVMGEIRRILRKIS